MYTPVCVQARCGCIADKYIEFEFVIIMIDVLLHKIEVCYPRAPRQTLVLERRRGRVAPTRAGVSAHPFQPSALLRFRDSREPCASRCPSHASGIQHAASSNNCDVNLAASAVESFTRAAPSRCEFLSCPPPPHAPPPCFVPSFLACSVARNPLHLNSVPRRGVSQACNVGLIESHNASSAFAGSAAADAYPPGQLGEGAIDDRARGGRGLRGIL